jgi:DNA polymerase elongation subunit (family B)
VFVKILAFDCEVLPIGGRFPDPKESPILLISMHFNYDLVVEERKIRNIILVLTKDENENGKVEFGGVNEERLVMYLTDEAVMIKKLFDLMKENDCLVGFNSNGFDIPYVIDRWKALGGESIKVGNNEKNLYYKKHLSKGMTVTKVGNLTGKIIFDNLYLLRREDESNIFKKQYNLKNVTLKHVSKEILKIEKLEFSVEEMIDYWENGWNKEEVRNKFLLYCSRDSELALMFVTKFRLLDRFMMMSRRSGKPVQTVIDSLGSGILVENLLLKAYKKEDRVMPCRGTSVRNIEELKGAEVMTPKLGVSENIASADFSSLYPSIMITHNICYSTVILDKEEARQLVLEGKAVEEVDEKRDVYGTFIKKEVYVGIVPKILTGLLGERASLKKELKKQEKGSSTYILFDAQQQAVKILLNSFYGYSGDAGAKLYYWTVATAVTTNGRQVIKKTWHIITDEIGVVDFEGRRFRLDISAGDSVTGDMPVLFFEKDSNGRFIANVLPIAELYNHYYGHGTLLNFMVNKKEVYVEGKTGLVLLKGVYKHKVTKKGFRVRTCCGLTKVTEDHSLFRWGKEIKPSELNIGSHIDTTEMLDIFCGLGENDGLIGDLKGGLRKEESDLAWVLGLFVAEGYCNCTCGGKWSRKCTWHIGQNDIKILEKCKDILDKYYKGKYHFKIIDIMESSGVYRLYAKGDVIEIVNEYRRLFYTDDDIDEYGYKKIPPIILNADKECIMEFIEGYLLGDAYKSYDYKNGKWEFTTNSLVLYKGLEFLFSRFNYRITLDVDERTIIKRDGKDYVCKDRKKAYTGTVRDMSERYKYGKSDIRQIKEFNINDEYVYDLTTDDATFVCGIGNILHHNTDSSYIEVIPTDDGGISRKEVVGCVNYVLEHVNSVIEKPMNLAFEHYIARIIIVAKKRYAMLVVDDAGKSTIISKGIESVRRDWCNFATENMSTIVDYVLTEKDLVVGVSKSVELVKTQGRKLKKGQIDVAKLVLSNNLTKPITDYDNKEAHVLVAIKNKERGRPSQIGDRVQFLICNNGRELISEKAEDVEWALKNKIPIDYDYYLHHQLVPPTMRILGLLGIKKEVLITGMDEKQTTLSKWF